MREGGKDAVNQLGDFLANHPNSVVVITEPGDKVGTLIKNLAARNLTEATAKRLLHGLIATQL